MHTRTNVTYVHVSWDAQRQNKTPTTHPNLRGILPQGELMCQYDSDLFNALPPFPSLSSPFLSFTLCQPLSSQTASLVFSFLPLFFPNLTSFFSYIICHCLFSLPSELAPHTCPLYHSSPLLLPSSISISCPNFHWSPQPPPPSCPLAHVLVKPNSSLIAPLLIYNGTERTGQSLKGWENFRQRREETAGGGREERDRGR